MLGEVAQHRSALPRVVDPARRAVVEDDGLDVVVLRRQVEREPHAHGEAHHAELAAHGGVRAQAVEAARPRARSRPPRRARSTSACASAIVRAVRPSHRSGASATKPSPASRSQKRRMPSLSPHHACSTSTPGPPPGRGGDVVRLSLATWSSRSCAARDRCDRVDAVPHVLGVGSPRSGRSARSGCGTGSRSPPRCAPRAGGPPPRPDRRPFTSQHTSPADSASSRGVLSLTPPMPASPSFSSAARACVRRATSARPPSPAWTSTASGSAQRCSNEWKPPGVISAPGGASSGGAALDPRAVDARVERRDGRGEPAPGVRRGPDEPGAARAEQPLVAAGRQHVDAEVGRRRVLGAEAVHAVDAQEDALALAPPAVRVGHGGGDLTQRQLHPARGVHPGERERTRSRAERARHGRDDPVHRRRLRLVVQAHCAGPSRRRAARAGAATRGWRRSRAPR